MRAIVLRDFGDPSVLKLEEWPRPEPKPREAVVEIRAVGVPYHDVVERQGLLRGELPRIIGNEIAGQVVALGERVRSLTIGDRVVAKGFHSCGVCRYCRTGMETLCIRRQNVRGGYAEFAALHEEVLVKLPSEIGFTEACSLGSSASVALNAVRDVARARLGETVLVTGASGGVGLPAIAFAKATGATVVALTRSAAKQGALADAGADHVVVAATGDDFSEQVLSLSGGAGADVVIDAVGSRMFRPSFRSLANGGRYVFIGQLFREEISLNPARLMFKAATMVGVVNARRDHLEDTVRLVAAGVFRPRVAALLPLEKATDAHAMVQAGDQIGRVVLRPFD